MRVLIVNTSERAGGAAIAAGRLAGALNRHGVKARMLVASKQTRALWVAQAGSDAGNMLRKAWERAVIGLHTRLSRRTLFSVSVANTGVDIARTREFREADVVHLHWVNQGMLSLRGIRRILDSGKPVVWTMHDAWPATAICHLSLGCQNFKTQCRRCKYLPGGGGKNDLAARVWRRKAAVLRGRSVWFVACSRWLAGEAKKSALLRGQQVACIPNPIDTRVFHPTDKAEARRRLGLPEGKRLVLFASQRVTHENKGMSYLIEACRKLHAEHAELASEVELMVLGGHAEDIREQLPMKMHALGYVSDTARIVDVYNAADVFVLPSLSENLPNTIMEAMACGVPSIGFNVGGIPEEIDHRRNGYVARYRDSDDLAEGIRWVLGEADYDALSQQAVHKVHTSYSEQSVALHYTELYQEALAQKAVFK